MKGLVVILIKTREWKVGWYISNYREPKAGRPIKNKEKGKAGGIFKITKWKACMYIENHRDWKSYHVDH